MLMHDRTNSIDIKDESKVPALSKSLEQKIRKASQYLGSYDERFLNKQGRKNFRIRKNNNRDRSGSRSLSIEPSEEDAVRLRSIDAKAGESEAEEEERKMAGKKLDKLQISLQHKEGEPKISAKKQAKTDTQ